MAATLEDTIGRLRAAQAQNRRCVADVSHELRTPLGALVGGGSILREHLDALPPKRAGPASSSSTTSPGCATGRRADGALAVRRRRGDARAGPGRPRPPRRDVAAARSPKPSSSSRRGRSLVESDPRRPERILVNLLDNAAEHAPGAPVTYSYSGMPTEGAVELVVEDQVRGSQQRPQADLRRRRRRTRPAEAGAAGSGWRSPASARRCWRDPARRPPHQRRAGGRAPPPCRPIVTRR